MSWVDDETYFGPDRREMRGFRLLNRRRQDSARATPSLASLLRKLQFWGENISGFNAAAVERYRARVQTVAKLARERGEPGVEVWLSALDRQLALAVARRDGAIAELSAQHLQRAIATLA